MGISGDMFCCLPGCFGSWQLSRCGKSTAASHMTFNKLYMFTQVTQVTKWD